MLGFQICSAGRENKENDATEVQIKGGFYLFRNLRSQPGGAWAGCRAGLGRARRWGVEPSSVWALSAVTFIVAVASAPYALAEAPPLDRKTRLANATAMFHERCKKAGEIVHRTVDGVEGLYLLKLRPEEINYGDQFRMDDPYGSGIRGKGYITTYLLGRNSKGSLVETGATARGYRYIEAIDPAGGKRYRYTGCIDQPWLCDKRYGQWVRGNESHEECAFQDHRTLHAANDPKRLAA